MNKKELKCKCGVDLTNHTGAIEVRNNKEGIWVNVWKYRCWSCGQGYYRYLPDDIEIKND